MALAAVALVQLGLAAALLIGLRVDVLRHNEIVSRLIELTIPPPPPPKLIVTPERVREHRTASAPKTKPVPIGGMPGPVPSHALPAPVPVVPLPSLTPPSGGGNGAGPATGSGAGGGSGGQGYGEGGGGTDLELISGEIRPSDYPKHLGNAGVGGRVGVTFTVQPNGRVTDCRVTHSSGVGELDALTCRLMEQRFRFRPSTDRYGRPIADEVDWDQDWIAPRGD